ncbi:conserved hypothetical protein [Leishmania major strain Friedlin]|uniref:Uncharacterized protein n=1 Tax=Leishmania major TaxID=5664 RepID=Q4Q378_LEIMA|nr:conserved hypothetical protein [Leishmania major strain Friedlin]CAG9581970.1 hypothetical_protein_-_conserved [Leishmania major strain Friedlin]CAJ07834.1 conserved hypothetical protein [Leishmania major strain Friedlin]|eukprot:XP_001686220.1 conserved hypothetical protein [Leishmania major strain Friedlin]
MELQEIDHLLEELTALLASQESGRDDAAIEPAILNAVADYVEGVDSTGAGLDHLRKALEAAVGEDDRSAKQRMKAAGCSRAIRLLHDAAWLA